MILLRPLFVLHDWASTLLVKHFVLVKRLILVGAHVTLFGFLLPDIRRNFGSAAEIMLLAVLFLSPLSMLFRMRLLQQLMGLRRELGILMAYLATVHGVGYLIDPNRSVSILELFQTTGLSPESVPYALGIGAYMLTLPLLLTSNAWSQRWLGGRDWKRLHRLVYIVLPLVLIHHFSIRRGVSMDTFIQAGAYFGIYLLMKVLVWKNFIAPLRTVMVWVASGYRDYRNSLSVSPVI